MTQDVCELCVHTLRGDETDYTKRRTWSTLVVKLMRESGETDLE